MVENSVFKCINTNKIDRVYLNYIVIKMIDIEKTILLWLFAITLIGFMIMITASIIDSNLTLYLTLGTLFVLYLLTFIFSKYCINTNNDQSIDSLVRNQHIQQCN